MKIISKFIVVCLLCVSYITSAQQIQTDRPNETEGPGTISKHHLQIESGLSIQQENNENTFEVPEIVLRYGFIKNLEFRIESDFKITKEENDTHYGIEPVFVGLKYHIIDHKKIIPDVALLGRVSIPWLAESAYKEEKYSPELRVLAQHEFSKTTHLGYNMGVQWLSDTSKPEYIYTLSADHSLTKKIKFTVETYGLAAPYHHAQNTADTAILFVVNNKLQLDIIAGTGVMHHYSDKFAKIGLSYRI